MVKRGEQSTPINPSHYKREGALESWDEMELILGTMGLMYFCLGNVLKYRYRSHDKNGIEDLQKSDVYMNKFRELFYKEEKISGFQNILHQN